MKLNIDRKKLEELAEKSEARKEQKSEMSKEEEIGIHKGTINTLLAERNELIRMISNVEMIMQAHLKRLEELGVKIPTGEPQNNK
jgi:cytochrome P450